MAQPTPFTRTGSVDKALGDIQLTLSELLANLELLQRDDGLLANRSVHPDSLTTATLAMMASDWTPLGMWATSTLYEIGNVVETGGSSYVCTIEHIAGVFNTDHLAGKWVVLGPGQSLLASIIASTAFDTISSTNVQDALEEILAEIHDHVDDTSAAHAASAVSYLPSGSGASAESTQTALRRIVAREQFDSDANFNTAAAALTGRVNLIARADNTDTDRLLSDKLADTFSVKDFGALGDNDNDDTDAIQAAIDEATAFVDSGSQPAPAFVYFPRGTYKCGNLILKRGVHLVGRPPIRLFSQVGPRLICLSGTTGYWLQTDPDADVRGAGLIGLSLYANNVDMIGFGARALLNGVIAGCYFEAFQQQCFTNLNVSGDATESAGVIHFYNNFFEGNKGTLAARQGVVEIKGQDHFFLNNEISGHGSSSLSDASLYDVAMRVACGNTFFGPGNVFENADIGLEVGVSGISGQTQNKFLGVRVDTNAGHGLVLTDSSLHIFTGCHFSRNGEATTNTYDNVNVPSAGGSQHTFDNCKFSDPNSRVRYHINDAKSSPTFFNRYVNPTFDNGAQTAKYTVSSSTVTSSAQSVFASVNTSQAANVGTGEDDLRSYSLVANSFTHTGNGLKGVAWGTTANNGNSKTLKVYFGTTAMLTASLTVSQLSPWRVEFEVYRTGASAQRYTVKFMQGGTTKQYDVASGTCTETDTSAITVKCTGEATSNNDIVQEGLEVELVNVVRSWS